MTSEELISTFRSLGPQEESVLFRFLADHLYELRLSGDRRILDSTDIREALIELSEALKVPHFSQSTSVPSPAEFRTSPKVTPRPPQPRWDRSCPDCGHEHEGRNECAKYLREGKFCQCESKVAFS